MEYLYRIKDFAESELKIKRSEFITSLKYVETISEAKEFISEISSQHKNANHNCWVYIVGKKGETMHSSDNGEPSGTAGKPMLNALQKYEMTNIVAVVTRYFGGVKLGIRGLIDAYFESVEHCLQNTKIYKIIEKKNFTVSTDYSFAEILKYKIGEFKAEIENVEYASDVKIKIIIEKHLANEIEKYFYEMQNAGKLQLLE